MSLARKLLKSALSSKQSAETISPSKYKTRRSLSLPNGVRTPVWSHHTPGTDVYEQYTKSLYMRAMA